MHLLGESYHALQGSRHGRSCVLRRHRGSTAPREAKGLGRGIKAFDQALWNRIVLSVAYEVVLQKFTQLEDLRQVLLSTADRTIAEMISEDSIWGTGVDIGSAEAAELPSGPAPTSWAGRSWRRAVP